MHWLFFLFISSFEFSTSVVPSLGAVTCAWCICTLAISPVPRSLFLAVPIEHLQVWHLFIFLSCLLISHLSLAILFMAPRPLGPRSFLFVVTFPPVLPPGWSPSRFSLPGHQVLIPSILLSFGSVCPALVPYSFLLPSYLAAASQVVLSPWLTRLQFMTLLPVVMLSFSIRCWLILVNLDSLLFGSAIFLSFLLALVIFSYVGFLSSPFRVLSVLRLVRILGFPPSSPSSFHPSRCRLVFSHGSSPSGVTFLHRFRLSSPAPTLSLSLPLFLRCSSFSVLSTPYGFGVVLLLYMTSCSLASCSLFRLGS